MRNTGKFFVAASLLAALALVSVGTPAQAGTPHNATYKALGQHSYHSYRGRSYPSYQYQQAAVAQRSYSVTPEATSDAPTMSNQNCAPAVAPAVPQAAVPQQQRSYSYQPQPAPAVQMRSYRGRRSSTPSYVLPRAMRNN